MSTKKSVVYDDDLNIHIYYELGDENCYLETPEGTVLLPKGMGERLKKLFKEEKNE